MKTGEMRMSKSSDQIYIIDAHSQGAMADFVHERDVLGAEIAQLAKVEGVEVEFHTYVGCMLGGKPNIMLKCPEDFIEKVKSLSNVLQVETLSPHEDTQAVPSIHAYFLNFSATKNKPAKRPPFTPK